MLVRTSAESFVTHCNVAYTGGPGQDCVIFKDLTMSAKQRPQSAARRPGKLVRESIAKIRNLHQR